MISGIRTNTFAMRGAAPAAAVALSLMATAATAPAARAQTVPAGTVVKVRLMDPLNSETARVGDRVRVRVADDDKSGLDEDTVFVGRVAEVQTASKTRPGVIDLRFGTIERNGAWQNVSGGLYSLNERDVREDASGRLVGKRQNSKDRAKLIGYGAAGGAVIGYLLKSNTGSAVTGGLIGALAGYLYGESQKGKEKESFRNVELKEGAEFGIMLDRSLRVQRRLAGRDRAETEDGGR